MPEGKAIVLHSGGMDSTVCLLMAKASGKHAISLGINYGQKQIVELAYAAKICEKYGFQRKTIDVSWDKPKRKIPTRRKIEEMDKSVSPAFLPARNAVFLSLATAESAGLAAEEIWIGVNALDYSGYPDCRPEFILAFERMLSEAMPKPPKIVAPLIEMTKPQIAEAAYKLGIGKDDTWSCYRPKIVNETYTPCGECDACILHEYAWKNISQFAKKDS